MRFARVRSGLAETHHDVAVTARDGAGTTLFSSGEVDRPFFHRSAIKPFQALAARRAGLELPAEHLAVTCSSHGGFPVHLTIVDRILSDHGLARDDLRCPPAWPRGEAARDLQIAHGRVRPERRFHNCSGKHAGWLAACMVAGWETRTYLAPDHPLQRSIVDIVRDMTASDPEPVGVDGCGAPAPRGDLAGLARAFARLTTDVDLAPIATAMGAYGALVADNTRPDGRFGTSWGGPSKVGAEGVFGAGLAGVGIAAKSADGSSPIAVAAVIEVADRIGLLPRGTDRWLSDVRRPAVLGGGTPVGRLELVEA